MKSYKIVLIFILFFCESFNSYASPAVVVSDEKKIYEIGKYLQILEDSSCKLGIHDVVTSDKFKDNTLQVPNLGVSNSAFWLKFTITNSMSYDFMLLELAQPTLDSVDLYSQNPDGTFDEVHFGEYKPFNQRTVKHQNYIFQLHIPLGESRTYFLRIRSGEQMMAPLSVSHPKTILESIMQKDLIFGVFFGLMLVMLLYNLFIYFTVRDKIYLYYVVYILITILNQASLQGYAFKYLWPNSPQLAISSVYLYPALAGLFAMLFAKMFLNTRHHVPKLDKGLMGLMGVFAIAILLLFVKKYKESFGIMQLNTMIGSLYVLYLSIAVLRKGYRPAMFFLVAWTVLLVGATIFVLKDFGVFPYNNLTASTLEIGSAFEVVLLSFALADKINILRKEREAAQAEALVALEENARIIREQNVILEAKVAERTVELKEANDGLSKALVDLKEAEMQLVESEKMASLGQLTAGIAHEINNPINFVTSNIKPLKRDVEMVIEMLDKVEMLSIADESLEDKKKKIDILKQDYDFDYLKTEIDYLLNGITEGSNRTAEIVKGLRIFSRLDEDDLKRANLNEGIDSTLVIVNNQLDKAEIVKEYSNIPDVECYPGKLNQVFLNMISNGLYALKEKFKGEKGGILTIKTSANDKSVFVSIRDNGTGMSEETKKKLFEPFFTTKDVGEGTGLGLSIAYNTIVKHNGTITVNSEIGEGTEFIIEIPIIHQQVN